ncbi:MAG: Gfo/Idh/MocA family oxidoreductase [Acidimicrobiia bacterium]|nr:Gfo/Idh/MocA family oxidoreductase [Acidimicrobiia bacterium]
MTIRLGLIGLGNWGHKLAATIGKLDGVDLASCFARSIDARADFADSYGCRPARSVDDLLTDDLDGVLVATPHSTHVELIEVVARAGLNVMVEKPLALTVSDARRCVVAAETAGVILQVAQYRRRLPATRAVKQLIDSGAIGTLYLVEGHFSRIWGPQTERPWRDDPTESPAGAMTALGVHMADNLLYWAGPAVRLSALSNRMGFHAGIDDITGALIEFESGVVGTITTSLRTPKLVNCAAHGSQIVASSEMDGLQLKTLTGNDDEETDRRYEPFDAVADNLAHFVECIRTGSQPETDGEAGVAVVEILEAMTLSAASNGATVELADLR